LKIETEKETSDFNIVKVYYRVYFLDNQN